VDINFVLPNGELSLLSGITETEAPQQGFTCTQLSYTFRPKSAQEGKESCTPHHFALQALAFGENKVYIHGTPRFPKSETQIYLDIEGLPDNESLLPHRRFWLSLREKRSSTRFGQITNHKEPDIFSSLSKRSASGMILESCIMGDMKQSP